MSGRMEERKSGRGRGSTFRRASASRRVLSPFPPFPLFPFLLLASALASGCAVFQLGSPLQLGAGAWTTEGGSPARTHATDLALRPPLEEAWSYDADAAF